MAGEKKGKAYEALIFLALQELVKAKKLSGPVHWNVTPKEMTIEPDLMTGSDPDSPKTVLLVSHCGSAKNSDMKMWRNLGELVETKTVLPQVPRVYCVLFGIMKTDWEPIQQHAFDQFVWVRQASHSWADDLDTFISECVPTFPTGKDNQTDFMRDEIKKASTKAKSAYQKLKSLLEAMHKAKSAALNKMWTDHRARVVPPSPGARNTSLRRGMSKLLIFEEIDSVIENALNSKPIVHQQGEYATKLGLVRTMSAKGVTNYTLVDKEISLAIKLVGSKNTIKIISSAPHSKLAAWLDQLRHVDQQEVCCNWIACNYSTTSNSASLLKELKNLHKNSSHLWPKKSTESPPKMVWLIEYLLELIKLTSGNKNGYGYAQLAREASKIKGMPQASDRVYSIVLSDWIRRNGIETMPDHVLSGIANTVSQRIIAIPKKDYVSSSAKLSPAFCQNLIEAKLCAYRGFDPLWELIIVTIPKIKKTKVITAFAEAVGGLKQAGKTSLAIIDNTLVNWQSCTDAGRDHKKKELCGRAIGLRYHWDGKSFIRRPGVEKMILVLDGTWRQSDLNALLRSGWDEIFYPDEMGKLAKAIV